MVIFFSSDVWKDPVTIYMGKDKFENEDLIKYAFENDIWFHVDKLSSAHIYLRLPNSIPSWENIPEEVLKDCAQLTKANSIEGNKRNNLTIIYTPASNLLKNQSMDTGQVSFKNNQLVKRVHVAARENVIINRLNKTKTVREVDHEAEKIERQKEETRIRRIAAAKRQKEEEELAKKRKEEAEARSYDRIFEQKNNQDDDEGNNSDGSDMSFM